MSDEEADGIELGHLTDRELLLLVAKQGNGTTKWVKSIDKRVTTLEAWKNYLSGAVAIVGAAVGYKVGGGHHP